MIWSAFFEHPGHELSTNFFISLYLARAYLVHRMLKNAPLVFWILLFEASCWSWWGIATKARDIVGVEYALWSRAASRQPRQLTADQVNCLFLQSVYRTSWPQKIKIVIQALTVLNSAWLQWFYKKLYFQIDKLLYIFHKTQYKNGCTFA